MYFNTLILSVLIYAVSAQYNDKDHDYYKEFLRNPSSQRIHFRFQQRRKDQPLQVEERDESVSQYLGRPRYTSTTPEPIPTFDTIKNFGEGEKPKPISTFDAEEWNHYYKADLGYQPPSHLPEHYATRVSNKPQSETPIQWHDPTSQLQQTAPQYPKDYQYYASQPKTQQYQPEYTAVPMKAPEYQKQYYQTPETTSTTTFPDTTQFIDPSEHYYIRQRAQNSRRHPSRGSHKFNEMDINVPTEIIFDEASTQAPITAAPTTYRPRIPPPVPTLSPWSGDNFGK